jgi:hypothetical protein
MRNSAILRALGAALLAVAAAGLAGCAAPAQKDNMAAEPVVATKKLPYSVHVETRGGQDTGALDSSNISNAELKAAIETSILKTQLFKSTVQGSNGDYELAVTVTQLTKPVFGASFTVTLETGWSLVKTSDKSVVMRKAVTSSHTAELSDSLLGITRMRLAVEGAVRKNIVQGLQAVSDLPL